MKKNSLIVLCLIYFLFCLVSCNPNVDIDHSDTKLLETKTSVSVLGEVKSIVEIDKKTSSKTKGVQDTLDYNTYVVEFSSLNKSFDDYEKQIASEVKDIDISEFTNNKGSIYVICKSYYEKEEDSAAYRDLSIFKGMNQSVGMYKKSRFSPDFSVDMDNQIEISTGEAKSYDWKTKTKGKADTYQFVTDEAVSSQFDGMKAAFEATSVNKVWQKMKDKTTPTVAEHADSFYIVELSNTTQTPYFNSIKLGSSASLKVDGYSLTSPNTASVYVKVIKYPANYINAYSLVFYWYENNTWNYSNSVGCNEGFCCKSYKEIDKVSFVSDFDTFAVFSDYINVVYEEKQCGEKTNRYIIEFSDYYDSFIPIVQSNVDYRDNLFCSAHEAGFLKENTKAYMIFVDNQVTDRAALLLKYNSGKWGSSYDFMNIEKDAQAECGFKLTVLKTKN